MYKSQPASYRKEVFDLPEDYIVDYFICYGSRDINKFKNIIIEEINNLSLNIELEDQFNGFMGGVQSMIVNNKRVWFVVEYGGIKLGEYIHLACMFGSKYNIMLGSCGGLNEQLNSCDIIIPVYSYGDESSTRMYARSNLNIHKSNEILSKKLKNKLQNDTIEGIRIYEGPIITCGAMLAETQEDIMQRSKEGYYGVEMETSTVFAISNHFEVPAGAIVYVSDNLIKDQIVGDKAHILQKELRNIIIRKIFKTSLQILFE